MMKDRKLNRRNDWNYDKPGWYFVTMCSWRMNMCFGKIVGSNFLPNKYGRIVKYQWLWMIDYFGGLGKDEYVVMPNHVHGLINIVRTGLDLSVLGTNVSKLMGAFKTTSSIKIHQSGFKDFRWHRSFYDRIIRNQSELERIRSYIKDNPKNWYRDKNNPNL